jgi:hypothetical protein
MSKSELNNPTLFNEIKTLIEQSKQEIAVTVNATLSTLYWQIGSFINIDILNNKRAIYGKEVIKTLSVKLTAEYGSGWSEKQLIPIKILNAVCNRFYYCFKSYNW